MFLRSLVVAAVMAISGSVAQAASGSAFGFNVAMGTPFLQQAGLNYQFSDKFGMSLGYNILDLTIGTAGLKLTMPELMFGYHPFGGSYFLAAGVGQEALKISSSTTSGQTVAIDVTAMTTIVKTGWMWGISNGGFWFGMDVAYIMPSSPSTTITAPGVPTTDTAYTDAQDSAKKFGETAYMNITFARLGWLF